MSLGKDMMLLVIIFLFGLMGFQRGVSQELFSLGGIFIGYVLGIRNTDLLVPVANRVHKMLLFALKGGFVAEDVDAVMAQIQQAKPLIATPQDRLNFGTAVFVFFFFLLWAIGSVVRKRAKEKLSSRLLGALLGAINGYLTLYFVLPRHFPSPEVTIRIPSQDLTSFLSEHLPLVVVAFSLLVIVLGLQASARRG